MSIGVKGLLFSQGVSGYAPLRRDRRARLEELQIGDGRPLPDHLKRQVSRELDRLELLLEQIKTVATEQDTFLVPAEEAVPTPAKMLLAVKGVGPDFASVLWQEGLFRHFENRRQVAAYAGLAPTPWQSGAVDREQGVSKSGNPANDHAATCLAVATTSARLGTQPLVPSAGRQQRSPPQADDYCFGP